MTIISGREYSRNPSKYIQRAKDGERVVVSSRGGYVELKPVDENDKEIKDYEKSKSFIAISSRRRKGHKDENLLKFNTGEELRAHLASL